MFLAQISTAPQLPPLPKGPTLERVRGPIEMPAYEPWQITLAVACGLLFIGLFIWLCLRTRIKGTAVVTPYEAAIRELDAAARLTTHNDERFVKLSSQALRRYLEDEFGLQFSARTSEEFLSKLKADTRFEADFHKQLRDTLAIIDRIKFADQAISTEERIRLTDTLHRLINQVHPATIMRGGET